jgi:magnesium chelatase subunit D
MTGSQTSGSDWERANLVAALFAIDPQCGGVVLRSGVGPARDAWLAVLGELLPMGAPILRAPASIDEDALNGGLDLAATLRTGKPVVTSGILAKVDAGVLLLPTAERLSLATAARVVAAMDRGAIDFDRRGVSAHSSARFGVVALDEGQSDEERTPEALTDRLAFRVDLGGVAWRQAAARFWTQAQISAARERLAAVRLEPAAVEALVAVGAHLGVASLRAPLQAVRVARACCALRGAQLADTEDIENAAQLVLAPRATKRPAVTPADSEDSEDPPPSDDGDGQGVANDGSSSDQAREAELEDLILAAAAAAIPPGMLGLLATNAGRAKPARESAVGAERAAARRGRPIATRRGALREGRLCLVDTLRAAAPWQAVRRDGRGPRRVIVKPEDFRILRFRVRAEQTAVFVVDASGSSAAKRLAEVKGAIELLLVDCYVRRDSVALIAFRGSSGEVVLPPTRSLARAKRTLSGLPGGGGTPLACGLDLALTLADGLRRKGQSPLLVLMTDGKANVARDGSHGRSRALEDALSAATRIRAAGIAALAIDTSPLPEALVDPPTLRLSKAMNARYLQLPYVDAARVSQAVRAASPKLG